MFSAFPLTDELVRDYLEEAPSTKDQERSEIYLKNFLSALFETAHIYAQQLFPPPTKVSYKKMAEAFHNLFVDPSRRTAFYEGLVAKAKENQSTTPWKSFAKLQGYLKKNCSDWPKKTFCSILLSIDEAHGLYTHRKKDTGSDFTLYSRLKSVLCEGINYNFAVISLSTMSHIPSLAPSKDVAASMREKASSHILPAPFTELPFDAYLHANPLIPDQLGLGSVGTVELTSKFGRPLYV